MPQAIDLPADRMESAGHLMIPGEHPVNTGGNRRIFGVSGSATPAAAEALAVAPWSALVPDLRALLR